MKSKPAGGKTQEILSRVNSSGALRISHPTCRIIVDALFYSGSTFIAAW
jgi:hypothetical protein